MTTEDPAATGPHPTGETTGETTGRTAGGGRAVLMAVGWTWVGVPFAYGVWELVRKVAQLFAG
ncbi:hypothetical protein HNP84_001893 [Thermocatellispora tengchongensis]|uniref:Oxalate:formate antiporter n=1 Tax=Thermocatellispora tengchongensis TaxID=1073253 RepID=A0A840P3Y1_9ACTN|nr:hypothetical protein [Thermocatellispora tengchongensis]MBB5132180.1 hypothetical protein [Thermocatellispora tengchongensis]